ncbi:MAG: 5'-methylthioadenosine/adenosylhomocysteine nucleosidase [Spirochaetales bacterium]|uniref:adenosylhomocysteine nucleosidase n=1 Tax=Candidatus Thalassospirochaeta sargassi TaxID=3119039 RepID=A0AAJ1IDS3_9SPIO|nr:5'-methylthioadenosine/adenosylhomocysteine nucleosidase [Spirochaetales bacterium]
MIALSAAMRPEIELIKKSIDDPKITKWHEREFISGRLCGKDVVAVQTGVGKILAAAVTQRLIDQFEPEALIMSGIGGSLNPDFRRGDLVIGLECLQHDFDSTAFGFKRGEIPYTDYSVIPSDPELVETALRWSGQLKTGRILTGDQFIDGAHKPEYSYLREELEGDIVEMEGAAAGLTAMINRVPFLIVRAVSDNADGEARGSYKKFLKSASDRSFALIEFLLKEIN